MRLTNVSQMQVQPGRLLTYSVTARAAEPPERLPLSFDQDRHVGLGSRPGSWMAVAFHLPVQAERETIAQAWLHVISRHGTLRTVFTKKQNDAAAPPAATPERDQQAGDQHCGGPQTDLQLSSVQIEPGTWEELTGQSPEAIRAILRAHFDAVCQSFNAPSHRLCLIEDPASARPAQVIIGSDHAHVDAWSLLVLARDLAHCVADLLEGHPPGVDLPPAESFASHSRHLANRPAPPPEVVARWREILEAGGGAMPTFPLDLGDISQPVEERVEIRDVFDAEELAAVEAHAKEHSVRLIAVAVSVMTRLAGELSGEPFRAVFPVHSRDDQRWYNSVGWFITNSALENDDAGYQSSYAAVKEAIRLGSYPLAPIMRTYGGMPQVPGMFAMSWLDHRKLPVNVAQDLNPQHVSAVIHTDGVMIWFVINETGLHLRCRYPDTRQARRSMRTWLAGLVYGLRAPLEQLALREIKGTAR
ncbi:peptide synthetase [Nesterenkonia alkaliphila]|uniref:Peptide synthetase n=1 Tax=Nesterenkonia alkaliphila TaxID=1463631 RepID=A0A7K1UG10_9MICC|nr:peptide synthetase [Nesterenkonia alkaliphila]MVT25379.1 peptide synthetase [Nesterenkonia alkaliphila]